jgi:hypothetical protein
MLEGAYAPSGTQFLKAHKRSRNRKLRENNTAQQLATIPWSTLRPGRPCGAHGPDERHVFGDDFRCIAAPNYLAISPCHRLHHAPHALYGGRRGADKGQLEQHQELLKIALFMRLLNKYFEGWALHQVQ